jgi:hypothetical protein
MIKVAQTNTRRCNIREATSSWASASGVQLHGQTPLISPLPLPLLPLSPSPPPFFLLPSSRISPWYTQPSSNFRIPLPRLTSSRNLRWHVSDFPDQMSASSSGPLKGKQHSHSHDTRGRRWHGNFPCGKNMQNNFHQQEGLPRFRQYTFHRRFILLSCMWSMLMCR